MADGIDGAAGAFRDEIRPETAPPSRERASDGRFVAQKERMFEERPVEGDEITGDTRDGGDDPRLIERERREADGWTNQRDAPEDKPERPRRPANDNVEPTNEEPPEQIGANDEGADDEGDADEKPDDGAKAAEEPKYEVTVDGQPVEVTLQEALKGYIREATFYQRMNKVSEAARAVEQEAQQTVQTRDQYAQRLEYLQRLIGSLSPPQPNWDQEFQVNPQAAHEKLKAHAAIQGQMQWAQEQMRQEQAARAAEYDKAAEKYANAEFPKFVQAANIQDEKTLNDKLTLMRNYLKELGFHEGEIATTYDSRMMLVALEGALYRQAQNEQLPKPVQPGKGRVLAPGAATPISREAGRRSIDEAMNKLAKTGHIDDATTFFQRVLR